MADEDADDGSRNADAGRVLPESCVEYMLFLLDSQVDSRRHLAQLETVRKSALKLAQEMTEDYIWQRGDFNLELKTENGLAYLHGVTDYGDAVEDEWLIVHMLRELTRSNPALWARVSDDDGEFLLVEAANVLPKWLNPEIDHNRVWIHGASLRIIQPKKESPSSSQVLSLEDAVAYIKSTPDALIQSPLIEAEAFYRLEKYPGQVQDSLHHSLVTIPRRLASVLHSLPKAVAPAVEAFYLREPIALKPVVSASGPLAFPPGDLVTVSVRFSKVLFAQLRSQQFETPARWKDVFAKAGKVPASSSGGDAAVRRLETGMKLTCGFEMLAAAAEKSNNRVVREFAIILEDLQEDGDDVLPSDQEIDSWKDARRDDDEAWLDINYEDFERELEGRRGGMPRNGKQGFGDAQTQADLRKIVSRFEAFLNDDDAGLEGAQLDDMDVDNDDDDSYDSDEDSESEDKEVSFDEEEFSRMMQEMMGLPPGDSQQRVSDKPKTVPKAKGDVSSLLNRNDDDEIRELTSQMEAELKGHGALKLDHPDTSSRNTIKGKAKAKGSGTAPQDPEGSDDGANGSDEDVDIDYNLARNILESFKSQGGMSGPTGNLLGMMGIQLPRDEDNENDEDEADGH